MARKKYILGIKIDFFFTFDGWHIHILWMSSR